jgi:hypothetical protein
LRDPHEGSPQMDCDHFSQIEIIWRFLARGVASVFRLSRVLNKKKMAPSHCR